MSILLGQIREEETPQSSPDSFTMDELCAKDYEQDISLRGRYTKQLYWLVVGWLLAILLILLLDGFYGAEWGNCYLCFQLSDKVLMSLIGGTTISVLGLFVIVVKYLFPQNTIKNAPRLK